MDKADIKKIEEFVRKKPRTMQEIAELIGKSWVTTDRLIEKISKEEGSIDVRTFRGGTRGALKIVYSVVNSVHATQIQERLLKIIENGRNKEDFSPFDIYQFAEKRQSLVASEAVRFEKLLGEAQQQILFFSGNLSWLDIDSPTLALL